MSFPKERYRFIHVPQIGKVIAISSYAGKPVRAQAVCDPEDEYNQEIGEELAAARCNLKVAKKRAMRAGEKFRQTQKEIEQTISNFEKAKAYYNDAGERLYKAAKELAEIERRLK